MDNVVASLSGLELLGNGLTYVGYLKAFHLSGIIGQPYASVGSQYTGVALKESIGAKRGVRSTPPRNIVSKESYLNWYHAW